MHMQESIHLRRLSPFEYKLLTLLLAQDGHTMSYNEVCNKLGSFIGPALDVNLFNLRRKLRRQGYDILCSSPGKDRVLTLVDDPR